MLKSTFISIITVQDIATQVCLLLCGQVTGCLHEPTPSAGNDRCKDLLERTGLEFSATLDEAVVIRKRKGTSGRQASLPLDRKQEQEELEVVTRCFREEPGR